MPHYARVHTLATISVLAFLAFSCSPRNDAATHSTPAQPPATQPTDVSLVDHADPQQLFKLVLAEQEKCQRKLSKLKFTSRSETRLFDPYERVTNLKIRTVIRDGDSAWCDLYDQPGLLDRAPRNGIARMYFVWDGRLFFSVGEGAAGGQMCEYSKHNIPKGIEPLMRSGADIYPEQRSAYGTSKFALSKVTDLDRKKHASYFEAEHTSDSDGRELYILKGWLGDRLSYPKPVWELTVDPNKGYMVIRGQNHEHSGHAKSTFVVTPNEIAPGIWFPTEWEVRSYGGAPDPSTGERQLGSISKYTFSDIILNPPIDESQFTWKAIPMSSGAGFMKDDGGGRYSMWMVVNNELKMQYKTTPQWHEYLKPFNLNTP